MTKPNAYPGRAVYVVDGARTPFLKAKGVPGPFSAADLAVASARALFLRLPVAATDLDSVVVGCVSPSPDEANIARIIGLRVGTGKAVPAFTVQRNCASGMQAIDSAAQSIATGRHDLVLAGGTESMSRSPLLWKPELVEWFSQFSRAKAPMSKVALLGKLKPAYFAPVVGLLRGLRDPVVNLSMGQTAENVAYRFGISREAMDSFSIVSHQRLAQAIDRRDMAELIHLFDTGGRAYTGDDGLRRDTSMGALDKLKPIFDSHGLVTAGNSSQVTDGAAMLLLASEDAVKKYQLPVIGRIVDAQWAALEPECMGLGPVHAATPIIQRQGLDLSQIDFWEINEAFAAQVLGCIEAWKEDRYCQEHLGLNGALGELDRRRLNTDGGAIAIGHPVGASGARIVLHLLHVLRRNKAKRGIAALCIGGGQGGAMLLESI